MSSNFGDTSKTKEILALRTEVGKQRLLLAQQIGRLEVLRPSGESDRAIEVDKEIRRLRRQSAKLLDTYLEAVELIVDLADLISGIAAITKEMNKVAAHIGGVVGALKVSSSMFNATASTVTLIKDAPKKAS
jgi:hypothetical protein